nr:MAG TPA: hypothetical protein [Caudoviricetes sp.]
MISSFLLCFQLNCGILCKKGACFKCRISSIFSKKTQ